MKKTLLVAIILIGHFAAVYSQQDSVLTLIKKTYMIPMRDGVKLFTVVLSPVNYAKPVPVLLQRTPYGSDLSIKEDAELKIDLLSPYFRNMVKDGYILVMQDIRGKFKSEGSFEMCRPLYHLSDKTKTDESTDTWDTVDWLIKNIKNNNGKAGILGVSYPGYMALDASVDPHPALKASSPQAPIVDMFLGDDFHHNGAFRLSYAFEYSYYVENAKEHSSPYPFPQFDLFNWYLNLGPLKNVNEKYFKNRIQAWNDFTKHPNYDSYWKKQSSLININTPQIPILFVGGYYDQEDLNGAQVMYTHLEKNDRFNRNYIVLGSLEPRTMVKSESGQSGQNSFWKQYREMV